MDKDYIYALKYDGKYMYIGSTTRLQARFREHKKKMSEHKHSAKVLNGKQDEVEMVALCSFNANSFLRVIIEGCFNSIYEPRNGNIVQQGLNKISVQRASQETSIALIQSLINSGELELLDELDLNKNSKSKKESFGRKSKI
ncbi:MAG: GIY-YIG nuclease family protein [Sarcina sp.]